MTQIGPRAGTGAEEILAPDLGLLLTAEGETWPRELRSEESVRWIRSYRELLSHEFELLLSNTRRTDVPSGQLAQLALRAALMWRVDLCIKLLLHIGWEWTTAAQMLDEIAEAITPQRLAAARTLVRSQFEQLEPQLEPQPEASDVSEVSQGEQTETPNVVLQATPAELDAALISIYSKSRDYHESRLELARRWWPSWISQAHLLQWQANLLDRDWDRLTPYDFRDIDSDNSKLFEILQSLENLCQLPALFETMSRDGVDPDELLAPDPTLWPSKFAVPIADFMSRLLTGSEVPQHRETLVYWLNHSQLPSETKPLTPANEATQLPPLQAAASHSDKSSEDAGALAGEGLALYALGRYDEALTAFDEALKLRSADANTWIHRANTLKILGRLREVQASYGRMSQAADELYSRGEAARQHGDLSAANEYLRQARILYPVVENQTGEAHSLLGLGEVARLRGDLPAAEEYFQQALRLYQEVASRLGEAHSLLGLGHVAIGRRELPAAEEYLRQALNLYQEVESRLGEAHSLLGLGEVARLRGDLPAAEEYFQQALRLYQEVASRLGEGNALTSLGDLAFSREDWDAAEEYFQRALVIDRQQEDRYGERIDLDRLGKLALQRGLLNDAATHFTAALALAEAINHPSILSDAHQRILQLADLLTQRQQLDDALALYQRLLVTDPLNTTAWASTGYVLYELGRHDEALAAWDHALALYPYHAYVLNYKARVLLEDLQRYDDALATAEESLSIEPASIRGWTLKGLALRRLNRPDEASAALEHALTFPSQSLDDWQSRSEALMALQRYDEALDATEQALALDATDKESQQRRDEALAALGRAASPNSPDIPNDSDTPPKQ